MHVVLREEYCELRGGGRGDDGKRWKTDVSVEHRMNGHRFTTTVSNPDLPVAIHTQSQESWSVSVIHKLPDSTPDHIRRQFETAYQLVLQSRHNPGLNIR